MSRQMECQERRFGKGEEGGRGGRLVKSREFLMNAYLTDESETCEYVGHRELFICFTRKEIVDIEVEEEEEEEDGGGGGGEVVRSRKQTMPTNATHSLLGIGITFGCTKFD